MKFYIVDDDPSIPMILQQILEQDPQNDVVGTATDAKMALADLMLTNVDIVLIDLLMPVISGTELVKKLKTAKPNLRFIMISQVRDSDLRAEAYQAGIEFFIDKPINIVEVKTVIQKVVQNIQMTAKLSNIQTLVDGGIVNSEPAVNQHAEQKEKILAILRYLGITSESGSSDILSVCQLMIDKNLSFKAIDFNQEYAIDDHEKKILFQRIRRAVKAGLTNLVSLYIDNMGDEILVEYANALYEYKNVRAEMAYHQGKRESGGKVSLQHFFDGLTHEI